VFAALRLAVLRGVDVRVLMPSRPDHRIVYAASSLFAFEAVRAGVRVFRYQPGFLHQKVVLVDDEVSAIGSANLDNRSFRLNFEMTLLTVDRGFADQVEHMLVNDFEQARRSPPKTAATPIACSNWDAHCAFDFADPVAPAGRPGAAVSDRCPHASTAGRDAIGVRLHGEDLVQVDPALLNA
jgi:phosphatidylserine/phosphatidylglycerophosphate/cardiolipin synthase-like enzyme